MVVLQVLKESDNRLRSCSPMGHRAGTPLQNLRPLGKSLFVFL